MLQRTEVVSYYNVAEVGGGILLYNFAEVGGGILSPRASMITGHLAVASDG